MHTFFGQVLIFFSDSSKLTYCEKIEWMISSKLNEGFCLFGFFRLNFRFRYLPATWPECRLLMAELRWLWWFWAFPRAWYWFWWCWCCCTWWPVFKWFCESGVIWGRALGTILLPVIKGQLVWLKRKVAFISQNVKLSINRIFQVKKKF